MKFGFDIHGVIDKLPKAFAAMSNALVDAGHEVHVITGPRITEEVVEELEGYGIKWTHIFSITDYYSEAEDVEVRWVDGDPWVDSHLWDRAKGDYCKRMNIDLHIDDSQDYGRYFKTPYARLEK